MADQWQQAAEKLKGNPQSASPSSPQNSPDDPWAKAAKNIGPSIPHGNRPATLPDINNEDLKNFGRSALEYAPVAGATAATMLAPELSIPAMAGIAALGGAGGQAVRQGVLAATGDEGAPQSFGDAAINTGKSGLEMGAGELGGRLIAKPLNWMLNKVSPTRLMGGSLRPTPNLKPADRAGMIKTLLDEGIPINQEGFGKLQNLQSDIHNDVMGDLQKRVNAGTATDINPLDVTKPVNRAISNARIQVNPSSDVNPMQGAKSEFLAKHSSPFIGPLQPQVTQSTAPSGRISTITNYSPARPTVKTPIPLMEAQAEKSGTYGHLQDKAYGEQKTGDIEGQKALAHGLMTEIEKRAPEVGPKNARYGRLADVQQPLVNSIGREENRNLIGLRIPVVDSPELKSMAAIGMNQVANSPVGRTIGKVTTPNRSLPLAGRIMINNASNWNPQ